METMEITFHASLVVLSVLYTILGMAYARIFARGVEGVAHYARPILLLTIALHLGSLLLRGAMVKSCPLSSPAEFMSMIAFSMLVIYSVLEARIGERTTGVFAIAPAFLLQVVATVWILSTADAGPVKMSLYSSFHSFAAVVAFSAVTVCGVYGILYLFLYGAIKGGRFGLFYQKMPSLDKLAELNLVATWIAFLGLTVMIAFGLGSYYRLEDSDVHLRQPEVILTAVLWLLYGVSIAARKLFGLGGKRLAYTTLLGSLLMAVAILVNLYGKGFHKW